MENNNCPEYISGTIQDNTYIKALQIQLLDSEARYKTLYESLYAPH